MSSPSFSWDTTLTEPTAYLASPCGCLQSISNLMSKTKPLAFPHSPLPNLLFPQSFPVSKKMAPFTQLFGPKGIFTLFQYSPTQSLSHHLHGFHQPGYDQLGNGPRQEPRVWTPCFLTPSLPLLPTWQLE